MIESASVIPSKITNALIRPTFAASYSLIQKKWFAKKQFQYLRIREDLFEDYYRDTSKISKSNMIAFLKANTEYKLKPGIQNSRAQVRIIVGEKEQKKMIRSAELLHMLMDTFPALYQRSVVPLWSVEVWAAVWTVVVVFIAVRQYRIMKE